MAPQPRRRSIGSALSEFRLRLHFLLHRLWIWLHVTLHAWAVGHAWARPPPVDPAIRRSASAAQEGGAPRRRLLLIGDDFALGMGDWVQLGDVPGIFNHMLFPLKGLFHRWDVAVCAVRGSTTQDWDPMQPHRRGTQTPVALGDAKQRRRSLGADDGLFDRVFDAERGGRFAFTDVVVVVLGVNDRCASEQTVERVQRIARRVADLGKMVVVCAPPVVPCLPPGSEARKLAVARNQAIATYLKQLDAAGPIRAGADFALVSDAPRFRFSGRYWSGAGYKFAAQLLVEPIFLACRTVENRQEIIKK